MYNKYNNKSKFYNMRYPTFWFSNSGLTLEIIINKLCCLKKKQITLDYEWDIESETSYIIKNTQPNSISSMRN